MKHFIVVLITAIFLFCGAIESRANLVTNGNFDSGLYGWDYDGVTVDNGEAVLNDTAIWCPYLAQEIFLDPGAFTIEFDFLNILSPEEPDDTFPDTVEISLFYSSEEALLDLFAPSLSGNNHYSGHVTDSMEKEGDGWLHYSVTFKGFEDPVALEFALFDYNYIIGDSTFRVDNIEINAAPVPEPSTMILIGIGIVSLAGALRKKIRKA